MCLANVVPDESVGVISGLRSLVRTVFWATIEPASRCTARNVNDQARAVLVMVLGPFIVASHFKRIKQYAN